MLKELFNFDSKENRLLAISDIHGEYDKLIDILKKVEFNPYKDKLVFCGDYIDRGQKSKETVRLFRQLDTWDSVYFLRGNHEQMAIEFVNNPNLDNSSLFYYNGGFDTVYSYGHDVKISADSLKILSDRQFKEDIKWFKTLPYMISIDNYIFVHAGLEPNVEIHNQDNEKMLWIREEFIYSDYNFGKIVVAGHTPQDEVKFKDNMILIDTGVCKSNGKLSCVDLTNKKVYQSD